MALFLRDDEELDCKYLNTLLGVSTGWSTSTSSTSCRPWRRTTRCRSKARAAHDDPVVPSVIGVWQGADLQEREVYDLMGIAFSGHPDLKRIFLWDGFPGHPLRKDFLALPGGYKPGLQRFPYEFPRPARLSQPRGAGRAAAPAVPRLVQPLPGQAAAEETAGGQLGVRGGGSTPRRRIAAEPRHHRAAALEPGASDRDGRRWRGATAARPKRPTEHRSARREEQA